MNEENEWMDEGRSEGMKELMEWMDVKESDLEFRKIEDVVSNKINVSVKNLNTIEA
jgi:hypothetical protein